MTHVNRKCSRHTTQPGNARRPVGPEEPFEPSPSEVSRTEPASGRRGKLLSRALQTELRSLLTGARSKAAEISSANITRPKVRTELTSLELFFPCSRIYLFFLESILKSPEARRWDRREGGGGRKRKNN